jgi:hypothetical protein
MQHGGHVCSWPHRNALHAATLLDWHAMIGNELYRQGIFYGGMYAVKSFIY